MITGLPQVVVLLAGLGAVKVGPRVRQVVIRDDDPDAVVDTSFSAEVLLVLREQGAARSGEWMTLVARLVLEPRQLALMRSLFQVVDPLGRKIVCLEQTWRTHVLREHRLLAGHEQLIAEAIARPVKITVSDHHHHRDRYWFALPLGVLGRASVLVVVVQFRGTNPRRGQLITAYPARSLTTLEDQRWPTAP